MRTNKAPVAFRERGADVPQGTAAAATLAARRCSRVLQVLVTLGLLVGFGTVATAQVGVRFSVPSVSIGIDIPAYPTLIQVPGYPVYYASELDANLFFYDGLYWVYVSDRWYASDWYNGPWQLVEPEDVPYFILRVPVHYYRRPPAYFFSWNRLAPPRWGEHWGRDWEQRHRDWNRPDGRSTPPRAPLPDYQRAYPRDHYPSRDQQQSLRDRDYRFRPRESEARRLWGSPPTAPRESKGRPAGPPAPSTNRADRDRRRQPPAPPERRVAPGASRTPSDRTGPRPADPRARRTPSDQPGPQRVDPSLRPQPSQQTAPSRKDSKDKPPG